MRAGSLDRTITIERYSGTTIDGYGATTPAWSTLATMRAEILEQSTDEKTGERGETTLATIMFRTRWLDGLTLADRIIYQGQPYNIRETKEIGRRRGLDIRCERIGP